MIDARVTLNQLPFLYSFDHLLDGDSVSFLKLIRKHIHAFKNVRWALSSHNCSLPLKVIVPVYINLPEPEAIIVLLLK